MKICVYLEFYNLCVGGIRTSYHNQKKILSQIGISHCKNWDKSCDILQVNYIGPRSVYLMKKAKLQGKKVIIWSHTTVEDTKQIFRYVPFLIPIFKRHLIKTYGLADLIFSPSEYTKSLLIAYGLPAEKIVVVSNGVDLANYYQDLTERHSWRKKFEHSAVTIGSMGLVIPRKGVDDFLFLAEKFPKNQFIWYGKIFKKYSNLFVKPLPKILPKNTKFPGCLVATKDIISAYNAMDIFLFPSYEENEGMAILEACAVGLPILVRDIPAYKGWLTHGKNCLKAKDDQEFEKYLARLISDADLRQRLGQEAKKTAQTKSLEALSQILLTEYNKLLIS
jgi:1,2-diacylglycerol-3-alpha-glucose alpha-1,2-glucosyltransferase